MIRCNCVAYVAIAIWCCFAVEGDVTVQTKYGTVRGFVTERSQVFYGIPYAAPPIGDLRWKQPQEPAPWAPNILNATSQIPGCPQYQCEAHNPEFVCPKYTSENCLFLNIWTPLSATPQSELPVMVFIHGGNFVHESGGTILYDGEAFVQKTGVILVNINYRLGAFGFLFTGTGPDDIRGNYGIMDQRQAFIWVNQNIRNFGGDPSKVTLFGQSAGAQSIAIHLMNAKSDAYFHQAIIESAPLDIPYKKTIDDLFFGNTIADLLNCSSRDVQCLRSKSADQIAKAETEARSKITSLKVLEFFEPLGPRVDGDEVVMEPMKSIRQRQFRDIPVIIGSVSEETRIYIYLTWKSPISTAVFETVLFAVYPSHIEEILKEYPVQNKTDVRDHLAQLATDFIFTCTARNASQSFSQENKSPVWLYSFDHAFSFLGWEPFSFCEHHVCHGSELPYVFYTAPLGNFKYTADEEKLSSQLMSYWANFAFTGNPNNGPHPVELEWPSYDASQAWPLMHFQTPSSSVIKDYRSDYCTFWDSIGYKA